MSDPPVRAAVLIVRPSRPTPTAEARRAPELGAVGVPRPVRIGRYWRCGSCGHICAGPETHHYPFDRETDAPGTRRCAICSAHCPEGFVLGPKALAARARFAGGVGRPRERDNEPSEAVAPPSDTSGARGDAKGTTSELQTDVAPLFGSPSVKPPPPGLGVLPGTGWTSQVPTSPRGKRVPPAPASEIQPQTIVPISGGGR
jgi:hypothetical protein